MLKRGLLLAGTVTLIGINATQVSSTMAGTIAQPSGPITLTVLGRDTAFGNNSEHLAVFPVKSDAQIDKLYDMVQQLQSLPIGQGKDFYRQRLKDLGYRIVTEYQDAEQWEFVVEKRAHNVRVAVPYDHATKKSTDVTATGERVVQ